MRSSSLRSWPNGCLPPSSEAHEVATTGVLAQLIETARQQANDGRIDRAKADAAAAAIQ